MTDQMFTKQHEGGIYRDINFDELVKADEDAQTLPELLKRSAERFRDNACFGTRPVMLKEMIKDNVSGREFEKLTLGPYEWETYNVVYERVKNFGKGLLKSGLKPGDRIAIFMETCADWMIAAHGAHVAGIVVVTIYSTLGEEATLFAMNETEVEFVITEARLLKTVARLSPNCPSIKHVIYTGESGADDLSAAPSAKSFKEFELFGMEATDVEFTAPQPDDVAVIMYTSGTTGMPKGVMITHLNVTSCAKGLALSDKQLGLSENDRYLAYLPLAHILEFVAEAMVLSLGAAIGFGSPMTLSDVSPKIKAGTRGDAPTLKPTLMAAVPAIMDRLRKGVTDKVNKSGWLGRTLFGYAYSARDNAVKHGGDTPIWNAVVFNKVRQSLGGELRMMISGGAPLSEDTQRFMNVVFGIPVAQGYGLTECTGAATIRATQNTQVGSVGVPICSNQIKLVDWEEGGYLLADKENPEIGMARGELLLSGYNLSLGYFKNESKTKEDFFIDERGTRWFHTGDIAQMMPNGNLMIIDRKKDLVKLQMGEYVSLGKVEASLKDSSFVENICVYADPLQSYCVALILPNAAKVKEAAPSGSMSYEDMLKTDEVKEAVMKSIQLEAKNSKLARFEIPAKIHICSEEWTAESELVTAALKLKRQNIYKHYADQLKEMYASSD